MKNHQSGFTLIELVVVIIILGVLSVTAAPKFLNLSSDARIASLNGLQGALKSANSLIYSLAAINGQHQLAAGSVDINGVTVNTVDGYIMATPADISAALDSSFNIMVNANDEFDEATFYLLTTTGC